MEILSEWKCLRKRAGKEKCIFFRNDRDDEIASI